MKFWEYCRDLQNKYYDSLEAVGGKGYYRKFDWKKFAETGNCMSLTCSCCPFNGHGCIGNSDFTIYERSELLNKELSEIYNMLEGVESKKTVMKEVTVWDGRPRMMWVWNDDESKKKKVTVVYITEGENHKVLTTDGYTAQWYRHCAEIGSESQKKRLMTNKELAWWLAAKPDREWLNGSSICHYRAYQDWLEDELVPDNMLVREGDESWHAPEVEV